MFVTFLRDTHMDADFEAIKPFLDVFNELEEKYGEEFRRLTSIEQKNFIAYAQQVGVQNLSDNMYNEREHFLPKQ